MELLAHISAACTHGHDARYRAQLSNYESFQRYERPANDNHLIAPDLPLSQLENRHFDLSTFLADTQTAVAALESQVVTSSLRGAILHQESAARLSPSDASCYSQPNPSPTWQSLSGLDGTRNEPLIAHSFTGPSRSARTALVRHDRSEPSPTKPSYSSTWSDNLPTELPSTYDISDEASSQRTSPRFKVVSGGRQGQLASAKKPAVPPWPTMPALLSPVDHLARSLRDGTTPTEKSTDADEICGGDSLQRQLEEGKKRKSRAGASSSQSTAVRMSQRSQAARPKDIEPKLASQPAIPTAERSLQFADWSSLLPLIIKPRPPATSTSQVPPSFVSPTLLSLISDPQLSDRYKPKMVSRPLRPTERGHWKFTANGEHFPPQAARDMWDFLRRLIENDHIGWGVWCARVSDTEGASAGLGQVRVFCWGEVVEHVYLMLYVASKNKIRKARPVWCDAAGQVVITT